METQVRQRMGPSGPLPGAGISGYGR